MSSVFELDPHPVKPRILFIGIAVSTHTRSWIELLKDADLNVRLFSIPSDVIPERWNVRTYVTGQLIGKNSSDQKFLYRGIPGLFRMLASRFFSNLKSDTYSRAEAWLARVIKVWRPDIIHTLGLYDNQGGIFYYRVRKKYQLEKYGKWVLQLRGGSDLTLRRHDPVYIDEIKQILDECDQIISDNIINIDYASELGIPGKKFASITPVPGTGGIDVTAYSLARSLKPSKRERIILWPKAYESPWSKALPVLEAIKTVWPAIQPCEIHMLAITPEVKSWFLTLPQYIRQHCHISERIPRVQVLELMKKARVLLAPSLVDGIPNTLYEAMACGVIPIVSPLETICSIVQVDKNVLFARNLYPEEIGSALTHAMSEDKLIDEVADRNLDLVSKIADRSRIVQRVIKYYYSLAGT